MKKSSLIRRSLVIVTALGLALALAFAQDKPVKIGGNVMQFNLFTKVAPVYPPDAKVSGIEGTVKLEITVDRSGHVSELKAVSGPAELTQSAMDAVKQWVYRPTMLNGEAVTVQTTVDVNYTLAQ